MDSTSMENQLICRVCLTIVENKTQSFGYIEDAIGNLKDMLMCCVPEMDIYVSSNPIMCFPCIQLMVTVYNFKMKCLNTETLIRSYIQRNNLMEYNQVNLACVIKDLIKISLEEQNKICKNNRNIEGNFRNSNNGVQGLENGQLCDPPAFEQNHLMEETLKSFSSSTNSVVLEASDEKEAILRRQVLMNNQKILQNLGLNPNLLESGILGNNGEINVNKDDNHNNTKNGIIEKQNVQHVQSDDFPSLRIIPCNNNKENFETNTVDDTSQCIENSGNNTQAKEENFDLQKENETSDRPRLIIKISKNKITIPALKKENPQEKENKEMDVEDTELEMSPNPEDNLEPNQTLENGQQIFQCTNCTFLTTNLDSYGSHHSTCTKDSPLKCPHCPHITSRLYGLKKHINSKHTKAIWYFCDFCPYSSTDSSCLRRHIIYVHAHKMGKEIKCRLCGFECKSSYHLKRHMAKHQDMSTLLQCEFCSYSTKDRSNFRKHIFTHNPRSTDCEFCSYKCVSPYQMKLHLRKVHNGVGLEDVDCRSEVSIAEVVRDISAAINQARSYSEPLAN